MKILFELFDESNVIYEHLRLEVFDLIFDMGAIRQVAFI